MSVKGKLLKEHLLLLVLSTNVHEDIELTVSKLQRAYAALPKDSGYRDSSSRARRLLESLKGDVLARVFSYRSEPALFTSAMVSPKARLYAELAVEQLPRPGVRVRLGDAFVMRELEHKDYFSVDRKQLRRTTWWVEKCALPLMLKEGYNASK